MGDFFWSQYNSSQPVEKIDPIKKLNELKPVTNNNTFKKSHETTDNQIEILEQKVRQSQDKINVLTKELNTVNIKIKQLEETFKYLRNMY